MFLRLLTWWNTSTLNTAFSTWLRGKKVGEDALGNVYYQSKDGKRWVIYKGTIEASRISPEWHGWLHYTWDHPPTEVALPRKGWEQPHQENLTGTAGAYLPAGSLRRAEPMPRRDYEAWQPE
ncbi:NADH:ubiquinone oxidoreductase subunit NDUFA12 [Paracoccus sp. p4-l81]|uniref:NADH:ubiquinone oxidoreductase subunit NDUFA12 n=1 Tax=unclassified Paracoccus (in: a-proteobacteria) TaxID=2688777 RepID=UPI0035B8E859